VSGLILVTNVLKNKKLILTPMLLMSTYWLLIGIAIPIFPHLSDVFHVSLNVIHVIASIALMVSGISPFVWGMMTDKIKFKRFLVMMTMIAIIMLFLTAIATNIWFFATTFILGCTILGSFIVFGRSFPVLYLDHEADIKKAFFFIIFGCYTITMMAPLLAGQINKILGWRFVFLVLPLWLIVLLLLFIISLPQLRHVSIQRQWYQDIGQCLTNKVFLGNTLIAFFTTLIMGSYCIAFPFWMTSVYHISPTKISYYLLPILLPGAILPLLANYIQKYYPDSVIFRYYILLSLAAASLAVSFIFLSHLSLWLWTIPGILTTAAGVYMIPMTCCRALTSMTHHYNTASGLFSVNVYFSGGIGVYITSFVTLPTFYRFGILILLTVIINTIIWLFLLNQTIE